MYVGLYHTDKGYGGPTLPAGVCTVPCPGFSDFWGEGYQAASPSEFRMARPYFKGKVAASNLAQSSKGWSNWEIIPGNEPNHPIELTGWTPESYSDWLHEVKRQNPFARLWYSGPSPSIPGWQLWLSSPEVHKTILECCDGVALDVYGRLDEFTATLEECKHLLPAGVKFGVKECNPGWGRPRSEYGGGLEAWIKDHLPGILSSAKSAGCHFWVYYAENWSQSGEPENLSARGTAIPQVLADWWESNKTAAISPTPRIDIPHPDRSKGMTEQEALTVAKDIWTRGGGTLVPGQALTDYWLNQFKAGKWLGSPLGGERTTANGKYVYHLFTNCSLWCEIGVWKVSEGLPPF